MPQYVTDSGPSNAMACSRF